MQETILLLRQQLNSLLDKRSVTIEQIADNETTSLSTCTEELLEKKNKEKSRIVSSGETYADEHTPTSVMSLNRVFSLEDSKECNNSAFYSSQVCMQVIPFLFWHLLHQEPNYAVLVLVAFSGFLAVKFCIHSAVHQCIYFLPRLLNWRI